MDAALGLPDELGVCVPLGVDAGEGLPESVRVAVCDDVCDVLPLRVGLGVTLGVAAALPVCVPLALCVWLGVASPVGVALPLAVVVPLRVCAELGDVVSLGDPVGEGVWLCVRLLLGVALCVRVRVWLGESEGEGVPVVLEVTDPVPV